MLSMSKCVYGLLWGVAKENKLTLRKQLLMGKDQNSITAKYYVTKNMFEHAMRN